MIRLAAVLCGALFGLGLVVSDMANPTRVLAFLDVTGRWDPSLALVMAGALIPSAIAYRWVRARNAPVLAAALHIPNQRQIDRNLVIGAAVFGVGWGWQAYARARPLHCCQRVNPLHSFSRPPWSSACSSTGSSTVPAQQRIRHESALTCAELACDRPTGSHRHTCLEKGGHLECHL